MLRKTAATLSVCAGLLFNFAPPKALAQTPTRPQPAVAVTQATPKPDLKAAFDKEVASAKLHTPTPAEYRRLDAARQQQQTTKSGLSKNDKIILVVFAVSMTVLIIALVKHGIEPSTSCSEDPSDPFCT